MGLFEKIGNWLLGGTRAATPAPAKEAAPEAAPVKEEAPKPVTTKVETPEPETPKPETIKVETPKPEPAKEEAPKAEPAKEEAPKPKKAVLDAVEMRSILKKESLALLDSLYMTTPGTCTNKCLIVWLDTDEPTFHSLLGFERELAEYWSVERGYAFYSVELKKGKPEGDARMVEVVPEVLNLYVQEQAVGASDPSVARKAVVKIFGGKGSLLQSEYELSSETLASEHRKLYNIGSAWRGLSAEPHRHRRQTRIGTEQMRQSRPCAHRFFRGPWLLPASRVRWQHFEPESHPGVPRRGMDRGGEHGTDGSLARQRSDRARQGRRIAV